MKNCMICLLALCLFCSALFCSGCGEAPEDKPGDGSVFADPDGTGYACLTAEEKQAFCDRVAACILQIAGKSDYVFWSYRSGFGLIDCDGDGTPEVVEYVPGGSFLNDYLVVWDLDTAVYLADVNGYNLKTAFAGDRLIFLTDSARQIGGERCRTLSEVSIDKRAGTSTYVQVFEEFELRDENGEITASEYTVIDFYEPRVVPAGVDPDGVRGLDYEGYNAENNRSHTVTKDGYEEARTDYFNRVRVIPGAELEILYWYDFIPEGKTFPEDPGHYARLMAEALCGSGQRLLYKEK